MRKNLFLVLSLLFIAQTASAETIAEFFTAYAKNGWKIERSQETLIKDQWDAQTQYREKTIMLSRNTDQKTLYHEFGHYYLFSINERFGDIYAKEGGIQIFAELIYTKGNLKKALQRAKQYCHHSRLLDWISFNENISLIEAERFSKDRWYQIPWELAQEFAFKIYNSDFGRALQKLHNKRAKMGV